MSDLPGWQERVIVERDSLENKLNLLREFMTHDEFMQLSPANRTLLSQQKDVMSEYLSILDKRIALF